MDEMDEYQEWLHMTWGFGMESGTSVPPPIGSARPQGEATAWRRSMV